MDTHEVKQTARQVGDNRAVELLARTGYAASGSCTSSSPSWCSRWRGRSGENADQSGALALLAQNALGKALLWVLVVGFAGLALWQLTGGHRGRR
jgi:hypothetical protein